MLNLTLSDLFFNHQHPNFDSLFDGDVSEVCESKIASAIKKDATDFYDTFVCICADYNCDSPDELVEDFLERL